MLSQPVPYLDTTVAGVAADAAKLGPVADPAAAVAGHDVQTLHSPASRSYLVSAAVAAAAATRS